MAEILVQYSNRVVQVTMNYTTVMSQLMLNICDMFNLDYKNVEFKVLGTRRIIKENDTINTLNLKKGDIIDILNI